MTATVLTINGGSSSIKFAVFAPGAPLGRTVSGQVERIGLSGTVLRATGVDARSHVNQPVDATDHGLAAEQLIRWLRERDDLGKVSAVGHRIVHGGLTYTAAQFITEEMVAELKRLRPLDPDHLPAEIALIEAVGRCLRGVPQVACFDTAFHHDLPRVARLFPVPRRYVAAGVRRYGFHGLSFAYLMGELARAAGPEAARGRVVLAHLGAGASLAAVHQGKCVDTTMGFTPTAGLMMATRSGDMDPGLLIYLMRNEQLSPDQLDDLVNRRSGLLGVSETSPDMRDLLARQADDPRAADAVAMFCYQTRKWIGSMAAALGGLDTLVFAGGIGENAPEVRARICDGLDFFGVQVHGGRNAAGAALISADDSRAAVRAIRTDEEAMIVHEVRRVLGDRLT
jgi:acetate kinase